MRRRRRKRLKGGGRHSRICCREDGTPKLVFSTERAALSAIPLFCEALQAYACEVHGWHVGHVLSREARRRGFELEDLRSGWRHAEDAEAA